MHPQIFRSSNRSAFQLCRRPESLTNCGHDNQRLNQKKKNSYSTWLHWSSKSKDNVVGSLNPDSSDFVIGSKKTSPGKTRIHSEKASYLGVAQAQSPSNKVLPWALFMKGLQRALWQGKLDFTNLGWLGSLNFIHFYTLLTVLNSNQFCPGKN